MARDGLTHDKFDARRRKEQLAFLVVKFLRAYTSFQSINADFLRCAEDGSLAGCGVFERVRELAESLLFDLKEEAHFLFRVSGAAAKPRSRDTRHILARMKTSIETRSIDSYIGTGYHLLLILQESLYQIERYAPELEREKGEISRILELARASDSIWTPEEKAELERLKALDEISVNLAAESRDLAARVMERCATLFTGTAEVIRHTVASACDNEILILNLLQNQDLIESVYGEGAAERIFSELCRGRGFSGRTGVARALAFAREKCGNVTGLPAAPAS
jgi:hypothetical protein